MGGGGRLKRLSSPLYWLSLVGSSTSLSLSDKIIIMNHNKEFFVSLASYHLKIPKESQKFHRSDAREQIGPSSLEGGL